MRMNNFTTWLYSFIYDDTILGDIARDHQYEAKHGRYSTEKELLSILRFRNQVAYEELSEAIQRRDNTNQE